MNVRASRPLSERVRNLHVEDCVELFAGQLAAGQAAILAAVSPSTCIHTYSLLWQHGHDALRLGEAQGGLSCSARAGQGPYLQDEPVGRCDRVAEQQHFRAGRLVGGSRHLICGRRVSSCIGACSRHAATARTPAWRSRSAGVGAAQPQEHTPPPSLYYPRGSPRPASSYLKRYIRMMYPKSPKVR
jgi:hypothetical protein